MNGMKKPGARLQVSRIVLDSSAVLAMILKEPGGERVEMLLDALVQGTPDEVAISSVNWCEVLTRLQRSPVSLTPEELAGILSGVELFPFDRGSAELAAQLNLAAAFLSLGDRACLALAAARNAAAWTADRAWAQMNLGVQLEMLR